MTKEFDHWSIGCYADKKEWYLLPTFRFKYDGGGFWGFCFHFLCFKLSFRYWPKGLPF